MLYRAASLALVLTALAVLSMPAASQGRPDLFPVPASPGGGQDGLVPRTSTLTGVVITDKGQPLANVQVVVYDIASGGIAGTTYSDQGGGFVFSLPEGSYEVVATSGIYSSRQEVRFNRWDESLRLTMPHAAPTADPAAPTVSVAQMRVPQKAANELKKAREAIDKGKLSDAEEHISNALSMHPRYSDALTLRAKLKVHNGDVKSATDDLASAIEYDSSCGPAHVALAAIYNSQARFEEGAREAERGVALSPKFWQAYYELGRAQLGKGDFEGALRNTTRAEQLTPRDNGFIHVVKGYALFALKSFTGAITEFETFLGQHEDGPVAAEVRQQLSLARTYEAAAQKE